MQVEIDDAPTRLRKLIEAAQAGEDVTLADGDTPVAKIVAIQEPSKRPFRLGLLEGVIAPPPDDFFDPLDEEELALWDGGA